MSLSPRPLSYCTNVHPARSLAEVESGLDRYTVRVRQELGRPLAAGLWLNRGVVSELLETPGGAERFAAGLDQRELSCHTLNAFPYGDFHSDRVKETVYLPDWSRPERLEYTRQCADLLAILLARDAEPSQGTISTLPLGFKGFDHPENFFDAAAANLLECAKHLDQLHRVTGKLIRLAIEPEPFCLLETTVEAIGFFERLWERAGREGILELVRTHLGLCFDVCHQAVEFEDVARSIAALDAAGVRINKVHLSCALQLDHPATNDSGRSALSQYVEPRYLHQTIARAADGRLERAVDLTRELIADPGPGFRDARTWRVHFHVPVDAARLGPLATTRPELVAALVAVARLDYAPDLEVETYTWGVLPGASGDLVENLTREMRAAYDLLIAAEFI